MQTTGGTPLTPGPPPGPRAAGRGDDRDGESVRGSGVPGSPDRADRAPSSAGGRIGQRLPAGPRRRCLVVFAAVGVLVWLLDAGTKVAAVAWLSDRPPVRLLGGVLTLHLTRNAGAAFSTATGYTAVLSLIACAVIVVVIRLAGRLESLAWAATLGLFLGGALGNLTDRIVRAPGPLRGHVVDFLQLPHWPIFNVADSAITVAAGLVVLLSLRGRPLSGPADREVTAGEAPVEVAAGEVTEGEPPRQQARDRETPGREAGAREARGEARGREAS